MLKDKQAWGFELDLTSCEPKVVGSNPAWRTEIN